MQKKTILILSVTLFCTCTSVSVDKFSEPHFDIDNSHHIVYPEKWPQKKPFRFLFVSDTQNPTSFWPKNDKPRQKIFQKFTDALRDSTDEIEMVFHSGDFVNNGKNAFEWKKYFDEIFWDKLTYQERGHFFPAIGNHEYKTWMFDYGGGSLKEYYYRFSHIRNYRNYFFIYSNSCFIVMDSGRNGFKKYFGSENWQNGFSEQVSWLKEIVFPYIEADEGAVSIKNVFVFFHKPGYITPIKIRNKQSIKVLEMFDKFNKNNNHKYKIIAFTGHFHSFAHINKDYDEDGEHKIDQIIAGIGGGRQWESWYLNHYQRIESLFDLDLYRKKKYLDETAGNIFDQTTFNKVRSLNQIFGYIEVVVDEKINIFFHRYDHRSGEFYVDYQYIR